MMTHELDVGQGPAFNGARMRAREEAAQGLGPLLATSRGVERSPTKARFGGEAPAGLAAPGAGLGPRRATMRARGGGVELGQGAEERHSRFPGRGARLARRDEGACKRHVTEEATPPRLDAPPGNLGPH